YAPKRASPAPRPIRRRSINAHYNHRQSTTKRTFNAPDNLRRKFKPLANQSTNIGFQKLHHPTAIGHQIIANMNASSWFENRRIYRKTAFRYSCRPPISVLPTENT
ncbi:hypothetical protein, partial [Desulfatitalea alkaliphila]